MRVSRGLVRLKSYTTHQQFTHNTPHTTQTIQQLSSYRAASIKGVRHPIHLAVRRSTSAPESKRISRHLTLPPAAARCSAVYLNRFTM